MPIISKLMLAASTRQLLIITSAIIPAVVYYLLLIFYALYSDVIVFNKYVAICYTCIAEGGGCMGKVIWIIRN